MSPAPADVAPIVPAASVLEDAATAAEKDAPVESAVAEPPEPPPESVKPETDGRGTPSHTREAPDAAANPPPAPPTGTLSVVTAPPTQVYIDGDLVGRAPFSDREIPIGPHQIAFVNEAQGIRREEWLMIIEGRTSEIRRNAEQLGAVARPPAGGRTPACGTRLLPCGRRQTCAWASG